VPLTNSEQARWLAEDVQQYESALRNYLRVHFPKLRDIDDLVQEAYARFFRAHRANKIAEPRAYLFATARNAALDLYRRNRVVLAEDMGEIDLESVIEDKPNAAENASHDQELEILSQAIAALPKRCRQVLTLRCFQGLSYREIARKLGISENTVNAQLGIGMLRCRRHLLARGVLTWNHHAFDH
jgi:RNA polymerase sigma factor (sigma-70 family)